MKRISDEAFFLGFCVEIYKTEKKMNGQDAFNYLYRSGATHLIIRCREGLQMTSPAYIIDSIDEYIKNRAVAPPELCTLPWGIAARRSQ